MTHISPAHVRIREHVRDHGQKFEFFGIRLRSQKIINSLQDGFVYFMCCQLSWTFGINQHLIHCSYDLR